MSEPVWRKSFFFIVTVIALPVVSWNIAWHPELFRPNMATLLSLGGLILLAAAFVVPFFMSKSPTSRGIWLAFAFGSVASLLIWLMLMWIPWRSLLLLAGALAAVMGLGFLTVKDNLVKGSPRKPTGTNHSAS